MPNDSMSVQEVADFLGISKNTVYDLIKRKQIPSYRVGHKLRVDAIDIDNYKSKSKTVADTVLQDQRAVQAEAFHFPANQPGPFYNEGMGISHWTTSAPNNNFIICGQDMILDLLASHLDRPPYHIPALRSYTGSYNGLVELYKGTVSISTANLWDSTTNTYNIPYLQGLLPSIDCVVINLAYQEVGFYVAKGNPKNINTWKDILRPEVSMINRELGSGVRVFVDESFKKFKLDKNQVQGYYNTAFSDISVASAIARGDADVSIGSEKTSAQMDSVAFIPLQKERLDIIIPKNDIFDPRVQATLAILKSPGFKAELSAIGSYDTIDTGKILLE
ncbi:MAG: substrate-binding domain-containing protein [Anaerocolumna sp.]